MSDAPCNFFLTVSKRQQTDSSHLPLWAAGMLKSERKNIDRFLSLRSGLRFSSIVSVRYTVDENSLNTMC